MHSRSKLLLGDDAISQLNGCKVAVFGLGGVGGYVVEILARQGVGELLLIDNDVFTISNLNRQILATNKSLGEYKVDEAIKRCKAINPNIIINGYKNFIDCKSIDCIDLTGCNYIVDAIDFVEGKIAIIEKSKSLNIPIISCMGTGNKLDPAKFKIVDIKKTEVCPLAKKMRKLLKDKNIDNVKTLFSTEEVIFKSGEVIGSVPFVPSVAGIMIAREVILDIIKC